MAIPTNREHLDNGSLSGCRVRGLARQVINPAGTATTLTAGQSGALCLFATAAGQTYVLPAVGANDVGMFFEFIVTLDGTAGAYSVTTDAATTFLVGGVDSMSDALAEGGGMHEADGTTVVAISLDSDATGRMVATQLFLTALSSTQWSITGTISTEGTTLTPF